MSFDWQNLTALLAVAAAGAYLARVAWLSIAKRKAAGCGSCGSCPSGALANQPQVFGIEPERDSAKVATNGQLGSKALGR
ncbi:MAG: hypothetical protein HY288_04295 [Planctomycetia bacterium]|nr:hypothetical protein [Planctomycetia bacterium]